MVRDLRVSASPDPLVSLGVLTGLGIVLVLGCSSQVPERRVAEAPVLEVQTIAERADAAPPVEAEPEQTSATRVDAGRVSNEAEVMPQEPEVSTPAMPMEVVPAAPITPAPEESTPEEPPPDVPMDPEEPLDPEEPPPDLPIDPEEPLDPEEPNEQRGHGGRLFGDLSEVERFERYYFQESGGQVVMEAEHFATQRYGNDDYRGARWWMVNSVDVNVKDDVPEFQERCEMAMKELQALDTTPGDGDQTIRQIITNHSDNPEEGWEAVFAEFGCDPDTTDPSTASGGAYVELLPDGLYNKNNEVPHAASNWYLPEQAPRAYYRVNFSTAGSYLITFRSLNRDTDSGDLHLGVGKSPGEAEHYQIRIGPPRTLEWEWLESNSFEVEQGEYYVLIAGREDGFEVDKLVVSQSTCVGCAGNGPDESPRVSTAE